jgi:HlyD family secretion protein
MIVVVILFVATNFYLLLKDDSPVARSFYIDQWTSAKEQNLKETKRTDGVTIPLEEQQVYYDTSKGSFEGFSVKKGEEVAPGTSLFYYSTDSYQDAIVQLESERDSLEKQMDGLEDQLDSLTDLQQDLTPSSFYDYDEEEIDPTQPINDLLANSVEVDIYKTESEINKLESEIEKYDERIAAVDEKLPQLEAVSDIAGIVQEVQHDLSNPVITIASAENKVQGMLTEKEQAMIEPGMEVSISLKNKTKTYKGTIEQVSKSPKEEPEVEKESQYPFTAVLDEPIEEWAHGTHVDVKIVTEERANAITVPEQAIKKIDKTKQVFVLNQGLVEKRNVTTGLQVGSIQQIEKGIAQGEYISGSPVQLSGQEKRTFYTPLKVTKWDQDMYKDMRKIVMLKQFGKGFLSF